MDAALCEFDLSTRESQNAHYSQVKKRLSQKRVPFIIVKKVDDEPRKPPSVTNIDPILEQGRYQPEDRRNKQGVNSGNYSGVRIIQRHICEWREAPLEELFANRRTHDICVTRQIAMYLCRHLTNKSLPQIGYAFNRDHTSILHAVRRVESMRSESSFNTLIEGYINALVPLLPLRLPFDMQASGQSSFYHGA